MMCKQNETKTEVISAMKERGDKFVRVRREVVHCLSSFDGAIQEAGGRVLSPCEMEKISLMDFITTIAAQNGIRFYYCKTSDPKGPSAEECD